MTLEIPFEKLTLLFIVVSVIGTVSVWIIINNSGVVVPTSTVSVKGSEADLAGGGQVRLTILKPENESFIPSNESLTKAHEKTDSDK